MHPKYCKMKQQRGPDYCDTEEDFDFLRHFRRLLEAVASGAR